MTPEERRRQLLGIGLRKFVERPVQELSLDEVAAEAGVSRGLLFHYFPTKTAYHQAVIEAAGRRVLRTVRPGADVTGEAGVRHVVERFYAQISRRREFYLAFVYGQLGATGGTADPDALVEATAITLRESISRLIVELLGLGETELVTAHAWVAYVEDRALQAAASPSDEVARAAEVEHCVRALRALLALPATTEQRWVDGA